MSRTEVISLIQQHRSHLSELGVKSLAIFGSFARGEENATSDIDILVEFEGKATFDGYMDTKFYLEDLLSTKVDLVVPQALKPRLKQNIMKDLIYVT
ncbi:MAG: nucleotidyltransferase family protein [Anaerolineales bacterium]|nr:nucleotidyltransferase family protein [Anaerolineales bacterium]MBX3035384.1 nucleotidyltransferase family protein [Anaerolineales bacterium]